MSLNYKINIIRCKLPYNVVNIYRFDDDQPDFFKPGFRAVVVENILLKTRFDVRLDEISGETTPTSDGATSNEDKGKPDICCVGIQKLIHDGVFVDRFSLHDVSKNFFIQRNFSEKLFDHRDRMIMPIVCAASYGMSGLRYGSGTAFNRSTKSKNILEPK